MRFINRKLKNFDNKGLTLIELICSVMILAIVGTIVGSVLVVSADSYDRGNSETKVQQEAQLVANQIDDLLIDATSDVTFDSGTLTIKQGTKEYKVVYNALTQELTYIEDGISQLMASGVTKFDVDVSDFQKYGYVHLDMEFVRKSQTYPAVFRITARNKDTTAATEMLASISLPNQITLEPNQKSPVFHPTTSGLTNTNLHWVVEGSTDSNTKVITEDGGQKIQIGKDEMSGMFRVVVSSEETGANGAPKAQTTIRVYVRRVNGIDITETSSNGTRYAAGSTYHLTATALGTSLDQVLGADYDTDYVDPRQMTWTVVGGTAIANVTVNPFNSNEATVTLTGNVTAGNSVVVKATAKHPAGVNKTNIPYGEVEETWTLMPLAQGPVDWPGGGWLRQTNTAQGTVNSGMQALKDSLGGTKHRVYFRFKEYPDGDWPKNPDGTEIWIANSPQFGGDADNSMSVNLRPLTTGVLDYHKDYQVQVKIIIVDNNENQVWPIEGPPGTPGRTPEDDYLHESIMVRATARFDSSADMLAMSSAGRLGETEAPTIRVSKDQGFELMKINDVTGVDLSGTSVPNDIRYILEKQQPDGTWVDKSGSVQQPSPSCLVTFRGDDFEGKYRVKTYLQNQNNKKFNDTYTAIVDDNPAKVNVQLYNDETGEGIYYFNVAKK